MADIGSTLIKGFIVLLTISYFIAIMYANSSPTVACEDVNFAVNNTFYPTAHSPIIITNGIYDDENCADAFPIARWTSNSTHVKLYTNGTTAYPNITVGHHYVNYDYRNDPYIMDINFGFVVAIIIIFMLVIFYNKFKHQK
jgi:hypothetical protein